MSDKPLDIKKFRKSIASEKSKQIGDFQFVQEEILGSSDRFWRPIDFPTLSPDRVQKSMARLVSEGELIRIIRGIYWRGVKDERDQIVYPKLIEVVKAILEIDAGVGYGQETAFKRLGFEPVEDYVSQDVVIAVPCRSPRSVPHSLVVSRSGASRRIAFNLNWLEVSFLEVLENHQFLKKNKKNRELMKTFANDFTGNKIDFDQLSIDPEKLVLASRTEKAKVRESLINIFKEIGRNDLADQIIPARKRNSQPGFYF